MTNLDSDLGETGHLFPQLLPDGKTLLFNVYSAEGTWAAVRSLETGEQKVVLEGVGPTRYVPSGHLVYVQAGTLMAAAFDLEQLQTKGNATPILQGVMQSGGGGFRRWHFLILELWYISRRESTHAKEVPWFG